MARTLRMMMLAISILVLFFGTLPQPTFSLELVITDTTLLDGSLVSYTVAAHGNFGEIIEAFGHPIVTTLSGRGVHHVWRPDPFGVATPSKEQHNSIFYNSDWSAYDTHILFEHEQTLLHSDSVSESNDDSTTGSLGLSLSFGDVPRSGFGDFGSTSDFSAWLLKPSHAGSFVPFMQIVIPADDTALLNIEVGPSFATEYFGGFPIGPYNNQPIAGDFDGDFDVDGRDFLIWQRGDSFDPLSPDDLTDWQNNYGLSPLEIARASVPEPPSILLLSAFNLWALSRGSRACMQY